MTISNIEPLARAVCERDLRRAGTPEINLAADVDRYWQLAAYRDWCARHPASIDA